MDKLFDAIAKYLPSPMFGWVLAVALAFWGVHYWRGFRDYGDTLRDKTFLSIAVVSAATLCLYLVNRTPPANLVHPPLLIVPYFDNDEREQYRTALVSQLDQVLARAGQSRAVSSLPFALADYSSALQNAKRYGAIAAIFQPVVIREKDSIKICFQIAFVGSGDSTPYAMLPVELPMATADEIANNLLAATGGRGGQESRNPLLSRLDTLERRLEGLSAELQKATAKSVAEPPLEYRRKHAIIVGVNELRTASSPFFRLQYAESDARAVQDVLQRYGFDSSLLLGESATRSSVLAQFDRLRQNATEDDLVVFYFAGNASAEAFGLPGRTLHLFLADSLPASAPSTLTINDLAGALNVIPARNTLALLDACNGTVGLQEAAIIKAVGPSGEGSKRTLQFFVASGDDESAVESRELGGGAFSRALVRVLGSAATSGQNLWMHDVVTQTTGFVHSQSPVKQTPKLVTVVGNREVYWSAGPPRVVR